MTVIASFNLERYTASLKIKETLSMPKQKSLRNKTPKDIKETKRENSIPSHKHSVRVWGGGGGITKNISRKDYFMGRTLTSFTYIYFGRCL